ncbi:prostamide/prostaglandin F synthase isoform X1 [Ailuropoda melanoleuca]|uniref:prostamide/prostaglandin F synthase isoform X1 n=1 Tax=Ailuropoda melanoleuca TaxID=9646 RepID=UPI001493FE1A|nr:prostamide/prostaglandin F synthase isoform X1 [Ailuropoda melanoleuca]
MSAVDLARVGACVLKHAVTGEVQRLEHCAGRPGEACARCGPQGQSCWHPGEPVWGLAAERRAAGGYQSLQGYPDRLPAAVGGDRVLLHFVQKSPGDYVPQETILQALGISAEGCASESPQKFPYSFGYSNGCYLTCKEDILRILLKFPRGEEEKTLLNWIFDAKNNLIPKSGYYKERRKETRCLLL